MPNKLGYGALNDNAATEIGSICAVYLNGCALGAGEYLIGDASGLANLLAHKKAPGFSHRVNNIGIIAAVKARKLIHIGINALIGKYVRRIERNVRGIFFLLGVPVGRSGFTFQVLA